MGPDLASQFEQSLLHASSGSSRAARFSAASKVGVATTAAVRASQLVRKWSTEAIGNDFRDETDPIAALGREETDLAFALPILQRKQRPKGVFRFVEVLGMQLASESPDKRTGFVGRNSYQGLEGGRSDVRIAIRRVRTLQTICYMIASHTRKNADYPLANCYVPVLDQAGQNARIGLDVRLELRYEH
jgi:hypothetical protein